MKLLSLRVDGDDHAGMVVDDLVLDVEAFRQQSPGRFQVLDARSDRLADAIDPLSLGTSELEQLANAVRDDRAMAEELTTSQVLLSLDGIRYNPPVLRPGKIFGVGLNYAAHAAEQGSTPPEFPLIFSKSVTALIGHQDLITLPRISDRVDYEAELAVVIGAKAKSVSADAAMDCVAGFTVMNDVTARDLQRRERQWARAKGLDTFAPCGPWLVTRAEIADPHALDIELTVNGEARQKSNTSDLIFRIPELIEFISQDLTLMPGDVITTGTPSGVGVYREPPVFLENGDVIEIRIDGIGVLRNGVGG